MPCSTGKAKQQYLHVSQPAQPHGGSSGYSSSLQNGPRLWWSSKTQPSTPCIANAEAVSTCPNHRQRSNRCTMPHWDGSNSLNSSWFGVLGVVKRWRNLNWKDHKHTVFIMDALSCCLCDAGVVWPGHLHVMHVYCLHLHPCIGAPFRHSSNYLIKWSHAKHGKKVMKWRLIKKCVHAPAQK